MRRTKGTQKIEVVKVEGVEEIATIYLNKNDGQFYATIGVDRVTGITLQDVRNEAESALSAGGKLDWIPVLEVQTSDEGEKATRLQLDYSRYYLGKRASGSWLRVEWDVVPDQRLRESRQFRVYHGGEYVDEIKIPLHLKETTRSRYGGDSREGAFHLLPYTEQMWNGLESMTKAIGVLQARIDDLMNSSEGRARIAAHGGKLLPAASAEAKSPDVLTTIWHPTKKAK